MSESTSNYVLGGDSNENAQNLQTLPLGTSVDVTVLNRMDFIVAIRKLIGNPSPYYLRALMNISLQVYLDEQGYHFEGKMKCRIAIPTIVDVLEVTVQAYGWSQVDAERALINAVHTELRKQFDASRPSSH